MSRNQQYRKWYGPSARTVKWSIAKVGAAGRTGDQSKIDSERLRHHALMLVIPKKDYTL